MNPFWGAKIAFVHTLHICLPGRACVPDCGEGCLLDGRHCFVGDKQGGGPGVGRDLMGCWCWWEWAGGYWSQKGGVTGVGHYLIGC